MDSCQLTEKDARMIKYCMKKVSSYSTIKTLILSNNALGSKGAEAISSVNFEELDLSNCKLGISGAHSIGKALSRVNSYKRLYLYNNGIKVEGCRFIAKALEENKSLEVLDLGSNLIRNKGFQALTSTLGTHIKLLALKNNKLKDKSFNEFMDAYHKSGNKTLKTLLLGSNDMSMYSIKLAMEALDGKLYLDLGLKLENHNDRTLFLCGILPNNKKPQLKKFFDSKGCGVIESIEVFHGKEKKKGKKNIFGFVKFAHKNGKMRVVKMVKDVEEKVIKPKKKNN
uniref:RRM domain-containing protein n=1 Tax=Euplotes harpa TaxID=151035 RepID=A0A7S3J241_9SPIT|mmetsp:Transcript_1266/g.1327  ORF Transcript_1266/g.1327 Transcript_1266/m.1327 type:complete len:283 (+) Transcript_1266:329-1177(+)